MSDETERLMMDAQLPRMRTAIATLRRERADFKRLTDADLSRFGLVAYTGTVLGIPCENPPPTPRERPYRLIPEMAR